MPTTKKNVKVRDLKPKKDAKGGAHFNVNNPATNNQTTNNPSVNKHTAVNRGQAVN